MKINKETLKDVTMKPVEVQGLATVSKAVKESVVEIKSRDEIRFLVDSYYQAQEYRKACDNQIRSLEQGFDTSVEDEVPSAMTWLAANKKNEEVQLKNLLNEYAKSQPVGRWLLDTMGIGPVIAAGLLAYFDIDKVSHCNQFWSYAGLNDNNTPWLGREKASKQVKEWITNHPGVKSNDLPVQCVADLAEKNHREFNSALRQANDTTKTSKKDSDKIHLTERSVSAWLAKPPYNKNLKVLCWKIGESFLKVSNKENSLYGMEFRRRLAYETQKNEEFGYQKEAEKALRNNNFTNKEVKACYESGKLPKGHILARAKRWTVKLFISHLFEALYYEKYREEPPKPYALAYLGHTDYIAPENDYREYIDD